MQFRAGFLRYGAGAESGALQQGGMPGSAGPLVEKAGIHATGNVGEEMPSLFQPQGEIEEELRGQGQVFQPGHGPELRVAAKEFIATHPGQRDFEALFRDLLGDDVGIDPIHGGQIHFHDRFLDGLDDLVGRKADLGVVGLVALGDEARVLAFVVGGVLKADGEGVEFAVQLARGQRGDDRGVDAAAEKARDRDVGEDVLVDSRLQQFPSAPDERGPAAGGCRVGKTRGWPVGHGLRLRS